MAVVKIRDALLLLVIFAVLLLRVLLSPPIWHHGEAREGLVVQGIVYNHEWILPYRNNDLPSKPPLFHWIAALPGLMFGVSDSIVRLPSVLGAAVMTIVTFLLGNAIAGPRVGWLAVGALLGMNEFWDSAADARVDMIFSAFVALSLAGFYFWYRSSCQISRAVCYLAAAFAVLAKGPAGILLPEAVIGLFLLMEGKPRLIKNLWSWSLVGIVLVIDIGWYCLAYQVGGQAFLGLQIWKENVLRVVGTGVPTQNDFFTLTSWLITRTLPWCLVLIFSFIQCCRGEWEDSEGRYLHAWWIAVFSVFALAAGKRSVYLLPLYPALALLAARWIDATVYPALDNSTKATLTLPIARGFRRATFATSVGSAILLFDLTMMLASSNYWHDSNARRARLTFIEAINATVPAKAPLFATPEVGNTDVMVLAYRLKRQIDSKPITCAEHNQYFLIPLSGGNLARVQTQTFASSNVDEISLVEVLSDQTPARNSDCL